jgi:4-hydroxythreonine-4-phosphate dehydrogenase
VNLAPGIALTTGEPAGIGPDLAVMIASTHADLAPVVIADPALLSERADILGRHLRIRPVGAGNDKLPAPETHTLDVLPVPRPAATICGEPDPANAEYVLETLRIAADGCMKRRFGAMVTGPVNKAIINEAGIPFTGHTEFLAEYVGGYPVMMLAAPGLHAALDLAAVLAGRTQTS